MVAGGVGAGPVPRSLGAAYGGKGMHFPLQPGCKVAGGRRLANLFRPMQRFSAPLPARRTKKQRQLFCAETILR